MTEMNDRQIATDYAQEINRLHERAQSLVQDVYADAMQLGSLLLKVKESLPHGAFSAWVNANLKLSLRQCQRYMGVVQGKPLPLPRRSGKSDSVSHLAPQTSSGIWKEDRWEPEPGFTYLFRDDDAAYWVVPAANGGTHVSKLYSGAKMSSVGFYWRYTIFGEITDPDFTSQFYVGTRHAPILRSGIHEILASYGLKDLKASLVFGTGDSTPSERPFGEPHPDDWYWDGPMPEDALYDQLSKRGLVNDLGAVLLF